MTGLYVACLVCGHPPAQPPEAGALSLSIDPNGENIRMTPHYPGCGRGIGGALLPTTPKGSSS
jgi:hypothetical protein